jgi:hypothetical protein
VEKLEQGFFQDMSRLARPHAAVVKFLNLWTGLLPVRFYLEKVY